MCNRHDNLAVIFTQNERKLKQTKNSTNMVQKHSKNTTERLRIFPATACFIIKVSI